MMVPASSTRDQALELHAARLGVDLDDGDVRAERERWRPGVEVLLRGELGEPPLAVRMLRDGRPVQRRNRGAGDVERPARGIEHDVVGVRLEHVGDEARARSSTTSAACAAAAPPICVDLDP